jgi:hypothetical protein
MNARMKRAMNSKNSGARIVENGALDRKIWAFEVLVAKWSFQDVLGAFLEFLRVARESWRKRQGLMQNLEKIQGF